WCLVLLCIHLRTPLLKLRSQTVDFRIRIRNSEFQSRTASLREFQLRLHSTSFTLELLLARVASHFRTSASITRSSSFNVLRPQRKLDLLESRFEISNLGLDIH